MKWYAQQNIAIRYIRFSEQRILLGFMSYSVNPQYIYIHNTWPVVWNPGFLYSEKFQSAN